MHFGLAVILAFVGLFWVMQLLRFKIKSPNFKTMLTTWLIYVLCVGSLGLNLATFTSAIAYRTAHLYSDEAVHADYEYINDSIRGEHYNEPYKREILVNIMSSYGYQYNKSDEIYESEINAIRKDLKVLEDARVFVQKPIRKNYFYSSNPDDYVKRSLYHRILLRHWIVLGVSLFYLPTLFFLVSRFGLRNVLISVFSTGVLVWLTKML